MFTLEFGYPEHPSYSLGVVEFVSRFIDKEDVNRIHIIRYKDFILFFLEFLFFYLIFMLFYL